MGGRFSRSRGPTGQTKPPPRPPGSSCKAGLKSEERRCGRNNLNNDPKNDPQISRENGLKVSRKLLEQYHQNCLSVFRERFDKRYPDGWAPTKEWCEQNRMRNWHLAAGLFLGWKFRAEYFEAATEAAREHDKIVVGRPWDKPAHIVAHETFHYRCALAFARAWRKQAFAIARSARKHKVKPFAIALPTEKNCKKAFRLGDDWSDLAAKSAESGKARRDIHKSMSRQK